MTCKHPMRTLLHALLPPAALCIALTAAAAADPAATAKSKSTDHQRGPVTRKMDDIGYLCVPTQHCIASSVPGQCVSLTDGVACKLEKQKSLFDE